jgi:hypothetical protein
LGIQADRLVCYDTSCLDLWEERVVGFGCLCVSAGACGGEEGYGDGDSILLSVWGWDEQGSVNEDGRRVEMERMLAREFWHALALYHETPGE